MTLVGTGHHVRPLHPIADNRLFTIVFQARSLLAKPLLSSVFSR